MEYESIIRPALYILYWVIVLICVLTVIKELREPSRALAWIVIIISFPFGGVILFLFFGQNFRKRWIFFRKEIKGFRYINAYYKRQIKDLEEISTQNSELSKNQQLITLLLNNSRSLLTKNNSIEILHDGQNTFNEIINTLQSATKSIHMEYYVYEDDEASRPISDILIRKAQEGVKVRLIFDGVGSWGLKNSFINKLRKEGIEISIFNPVRFPLLYKRLNNRNHRKIVIVDGTIGFTGGVNIAKRYLSNKWHDTHLKITGDAAKMLLAVFMLDWFKSTKEKIEKWNSYFPDNSNTTYGYSPMQIVASGPNTPWASIMQAYFEAITKSKNSVYISSPYFTPTQPILTALKVAALSGVDVRIILPNKSDVVFATWATQSYFRELLEAGVKIFLYKKGFVHTKMICVDENICSIGSVNMDERSFEENFEITAIMYDKKIIDSACNYFVDLCSKCHLLTSSEWESKRTHRNGLLEAICRLISPLL